MKSRLFLVTLLLVALQPKLAPANVVVRVPVDWNTIQLGMNHGYDGDTVSVWGPEGVPSPHTYYENVDFQGKSIFVVSWDNA